MFFQKKRADEGGRIGSLEVRIAALEEEVRALKELPAEWAAASKQLRRLFGQITRSAGWDALDKPKPPQETPRSPDQLTRDEIANMRV